MNKKKIAIHLVQILLIILFVFSITPKQFFQADTFFSVSVGERIVKYGFEEYTEEIENYVLNGVNPTSPKIVEIINKFNFWVDKYGHKTY